MAITVSLPTHFQSTEVTSENGAAMMQFPEEVYVMLFDQVTNAKEIKDRVVAGDGSVPDCVMVNPALVVDAFQVQVACSRAFMNQRQGTMKTKTVLTEVLFAMSPTMNIAESMKQFGISEASTSILVIVPKGPNSLSSVETSLTQLINGKLCSSEETFSKMDRAHVEKIFKLKGVPANANVSKIISGTIATKGYL
ncbi:hypothetical protein HDU81_007886 [Chytriomyces hyalinus]|nr:hypothetical protein HDU81_007886 [Chytriomyces hyalinus]